MRLTFHVLVVLAACLAAQSVAARGQRPVPPDSPQIPAFRSGVELVQVEVVVTDKNGTPVRGLTKEDFTSGIERMVDALDNYYLLGFYPSDPKGSAFPVPATRDVTRGGESVTREIGFVVNAGASRRH
jgi:hypothetical protein